MGMDRPLTFGPDEMTSLKEIVLSADFDLGGGGSLVNVDDMAERYMADLTDRPKLQRRLKVCCSLRQRHRRCLRAGGPGRAWMRSGAA